MGAVKRRLARDIGDVAAWREHDPEISVSVNIAAEALAYDDFSDRVREALDRHHLPPDALIFSSRYAPNCCALKYPQRRA